ncbi:hypothetical protein ccbrp13_02780 [Ktedonobacteria bacterium brp13]|nr:hypothetical protein ccbrp13_02780 [Ktedonobacteria bacterium brp13]
MQNENKWTNKRLLFLTVVGMLLLAGLLAGLFSGAIQQTLTLPMMQMLEQGGQNRSAPVKPKAGTGVGQSKMLQKTLRPSQPMQVGQNAQTQNTGNILAQDTFQRTNQQLWGQSSDGQQWHGDANTHNNFAIQNASGQISAAVNGSLNALLGAAQNNVDVLASSSVNQFGNNVNFGVVLRWQDPNNWYKALIDGSHLSILKRVNGQSTQLGSVPFVTQVGRVYSLRFQAVGVMLFAKVWRSDQAEPAQWQIVDSDMDLTNGQAGLRVVVAPGTVMNVYSFMETPANLSTGS